MTETIPPGMQAAIEAAVELYPEYAFEDAGDFIRHAIRQQFDTLEARAERTRSPEEAERIRNGIRQAATLATA